MGGANAYSNEIYGDAEFFFNTSHGGNDDLVGGANSHNNGLIGDADAMYSFSTGGGDTLAGGANSDFNRLIGDAVNMYDPSTGGNDTLTAIGSTNLLYGDAIATIHFALFVAAKLIGLRRVNSEDANAGAVDFERVAVNDGCLSDQAVGERGSR